MRLFGHTLNLTQHTATEEQKNAGVYDMTDIYQAELRALLTFETLPTQDEVVERAQRLANMAARSIGLGMTRVMIGGAPYLMAQLEKELRLRHMKPTYAFSARESVEVTGADGQVTKRSVFRHLGFVDAV